MRDSWPLIGRKDELRSARDMVRGRGGPAGVVIAGPAGVGKTRLAMEILDVARRHGARVRWAVATESAQALPLGPLLPLLTATGVEPVELVNHAARELSAGGGPAGVVIGVDDGHLLDGLSGLVLQQLVLGDAATLVLTLRAGEAVPDVLTSLWKDGHIARLELRPLSIDETGQLLEAALGAAVESATVRRLWSVTQGNPLYLRALVEGEKADGRLQRSAGVWRWGGRPRLSPGLTELIAARLGALSESERDVLDVLAFAEPLGLAVLEHLTDPAAVEAMEDRGLVELLPGRHSMVRLAHPLYGEVQRARCGALRARRLRGRIVQALNVVGDGGPESTLRRAVLALGSDLTPDGELLTAAAHIAASVPELPLAEQLARAAVQAGSGFTARLILASALIGLSRPADEELAALSVYASTDAERVRAAALSATYLLIGARLAEAREVLELAERSLTDVDQRHEVRAIRAAVESASARHDVALGLATAARARATLSPEATAFASWALVMTSGVTGQPHEMDRAAQTGHAALAETSSLTWLALPLAGHHVLGLRLAGRLSDARHIAERFRTDHGDKPFGAEGASLLLGCAELLTGRSGTAVRWLLEARSGLVAYPPNPWLATCLIDLARAHALSGDPVTARLTLADLEEVPAHVLDLLRPEAILAEASVLAAEGMTSAALARVHDAATVAARTGQLGHVVLALHDAVCLGDRSVTDRLAMLRVKVGGPFAAAACSHATALAADDGGGLLAASEDLEHIGMLLRAADAAAQAAFVYDRQGRRGSANLAAERARRLADLCGEATTPTLRTLVIPLPLSQREREIASLVAHGLSNREIAERLVVSIRTVEGHIYRACMKVGARSRDELGTIVRGDTRL